MKKGAPLTGGDGQQGAAQNQDQKLQEPEGQLEEHQLCFSSDPAAATSANKNMELIISRVYQANDSQGEGP